MPILKGTMTYTRFLVPADPKTPVDSIAEKLNLFKFRPLHHKGEDDESLGWSSYLSEYEHEQDIRVIDFSFDDKIILSMRKDSISLPKDLLKSMVKKSLSEYQREHHKFPDKSLRKEIEIAEAKSLRARILPKTKIVEAAWCISTGEIKLFCRSAPLIDNFIELFKQTFLLAPQRRDFVYEALSYSQRQHLGNAIDSLAHVPIYRAPIRVDVQ